MSRYTHSCIVKYKLESIKNRSLLQESMLNILNTINLDIWYHRSADDFSAITLWQEYFDPNAWEEAITRDVTIRFDDHAMHSSLSASEPDTIDISILWDDCSEDKHEIMLRLFKRFNEHYRFFTFFINPQRQVFCSHTHPIADSPMTREQAAAHLKTVDKILKECSHTILSLCRGGEPDEAKSHFLYRELKTEMAQAAQYP